MKETTLPGFEAIWYMCYYFKWGTSDYISRQIMDFKADKQKQLRTFSSLAACEFHGIGVKVDYVIRVLGSNELVALKSSRVRNVAVEIAKELSAAYAPNFIKKNRVTKPMKGLNKDQRKAELDGVYELYNCPDLNGKTVLIVDDIFTFGTCMEAIAEIFKAKWPKVKLYGFALAHNWQKGDGGITINEKDFIDKYEEFKSKS